MYAPADRWPGLASRYRPILIRTPSIVLVTSSFSALHQLCRVFQAKLIDPNPRRETDEQGGRVVRVLSAATPHDSSLDDKDFYSFVTLLDHGATIYMLGDPDDDFDPGASRIAEKNWIPEVNCVNYLMTIYHNTVYHGAISTSTRSSNSSPRSSTSTTPSPNVLRTRADYLKLPEIHGELDDERWSSSGRRRRNTSVARRRNLLSRILSFADTPTLSTCLRVNSTFFELSGKLLYRSIISPPGKHIFLRDVLKGAAIKTRTRSTRAGPPQTNFKTRLLKPCAGVEARIGPLHQQCHLPDVKAGCGQLVALKTLRVFGSDFAEYDCVDDQDFDCGFDQSCSLYRMQPTRVVVIDKLVQAELCTYALFFRTARLPSITFVFRSLFESWEEVVKLDLIPCHLPSLDRQMPKSDRGGDRKALRILFAGVSGGEADVRELPEDEQEIWATATDCLSELLDSGVDIYLLADPDRRAIIHEDIYGVEEMLEIDYFNAELAKKAGGRLDPERGLLQRRADYLQLDDTADELDEATMDRLRQDEAAYRRRKAQGADAGGD
ncbi:hypothetical protein JCM24511_05652 [Saitozyma sp. JCM 24511]|nr:hypothetical protein JCM24511_05652 [Saitozyma sp. JCM 24511]